MFEGNHADATAGTCSSSVAGQTVTLRRLELDAGTADCGGLYVDATRVEVENTLFVDNDAAISGGAAYLDAAEGSFVNDVVGWNTAPQGSAMTFVDSATVRVTNTVFRSNTGSAAIARAAGGAPTFAYDDFSGNDGELLGHGGGRRHRGEPDDAAGLRQRVGGQPPPACVEQEPATRGIGHPGRRRHAVHGLYGGPGSP